MDKAKELKTTTSIVREILEQDTRARNSDDYLYYMVCSQINEIMVHLPFWKVMLNRKDYKFPSFESVGRARRHLQSKFPELSADADVEAQRELNEEVFEEYAKGMV
jgi:hypothetical protein